MPRHFTRKGVFVIAIGSFAVAAAAFARSERYAERGPYLAFRVTDAPAECEESDDGEDRAMALALASLTPRDRSRIFELMDYASTRLEARLWPLGADMGEGEPVAELKEQLAPYMPALTAARALVRTRFCAEGLEARVVERCPADETCVALDPVGSRTSHGLDSSNARRARFLAWAHTTARRIDFGSSADARAAAEALREHTALASSTIGVVLTASDLALEPVAERAALFEAAQRLGRAMAANDIRSVTSLDAIGRSAPSGTVGAALRLSPTALIVVPRLSAYGRGSDVDAEIENALRAKGARWARVP